ncbi:hypothetical protein PVAP13_1KG305915 [Panicum virgatum]|uniref:EF-hand domain-containing protein n=1 Tax=Panicum virgatum TaxID=38727 RepID=A0A8T0XTN5_PANVG|nr:hypothetical protein PVAP13_1KG305915 [Panicum virgatum]
MTRRTMAEADADGDGFISLDEFAALNATVAGDAAAVEEDLRHAFCVFDADGTGTISATELARVLRGLGESASVGRRPERQRPHLHRGVQGHDGRGRMLRQDRIGENEKKNWWGLQLSTQIESHQTRGLGRNLEGLSK